MDTTDNATPPTDQAPHTQPPKRRCRVAIGVGIFAIVVGGVVWYGGRETTLQMIAQRAANASGGKLTLSGVTGSLYGHMHIAHVVLRSDTSLTSADDIDIDWKPWQFLSSGVEIDKLYARVLQVETLKETDEKTPMPKRLAPPFQVAVEDARIGKVLLVNRTTATPATTEIDDVRARLHGDKTQWKLDYANASTPFGQLAAAGTINNTLPYKLDANASLSQAKGDAKPGNIGAQLKVHAGGDLQNTLIDASGQAARAQGTAHIAMSPFADIPLQSLTLNAKNIDPGFFNPSLPTADLNLAVAAQIGATGGKNASIAGSVDLTNDGPQGTIDQQRLPLRAMRGKLGGTLTSMQISDARPGRRRQFYGQRLGAARP
jgi:translocation and assembly module TamB